MTLIRRSCESIRPGKYAVTWRTEVSAHQKLPPRPCAKSCRSWPLVGPTERQPERLGVRPEWHQRRDLVDLLDQLAGQRALLRSRDVLLDLGLRAGPHQGARHVRVRQHEAQ